MSWSRKILNAVLSQGEQGTRCSLLQLTSSQRLCRRTKGAAMTPLMRAATSSAIILTVNQVGQKEGEKLTYPHKSKPASVWHQLPTSNVFLMLGGGVCVGSGERVLAGASQLSNVCSPQGCLRSTSVVWTHAVWLESRKNMLRKPILLFPLGNWAFCSLP